MVESRILQSGELSVYEKTVYCVLCSFADNKTGICYPSYETIAARAGCSGRKAIACIEILAEKGLLRKEERATKNGGNKTNIYYLHGDMDGDSGEPDALALKGNAPESPSSGGSDAQSSASDS